MHTFGLIAIAAAAAVVGALPDVIDLPLGFAPAGIARAEDKTVYVASTTDGSIWKGSVETGVGEVVIAPVDSLAIGVKYDKRSGYLFVAGGFAGSVRVYDTAANYSLLADISLAGFNVTTLTNDIVITDEAAYITDSYQPQFYSVPLDYETGQLNSTSGTMSTTIPYSSGFPFIPAELNGNGIEEAEGGTLIVANTASGGLYAVDPITGDANLIDVGNVTMEPHSMRRRKNTLWVNDFQVQISEISLSDDLSCGAVAARSLTSELFDEASDLVRFGTSIYVVSGKFTTVAPEDILTTPYEIVRVDRDEGEYVCSTV